MSVYYQLLVVSLLLTLGSKAISNYNEYALPFHIIDLNCTGDEQNIWSCPSNGLTQCRYKRDAAVSCVEGWITSNYIIILYIYIYIYQLIQSTMLIVVMVNYDSLVNCHY